MAEISREKVAEVYNNLSRAPYEVCRAIATFLGEEADLMDILVKPVMKQHPKLEHLLPDLHAWVYLPIQYSVDFLERNLPLMKHHLEATQQGVTGATTTIHGVTGASTVQGYKAAVDEATVQRYSEMGKEAQELGALLEGCERKFRKFMHFARRVLDGVAQKASGRLIVTTQDYDMMDKRIRNSIYKQALGKDTWMLGYDLRFISRLTELQALSNLSWLNFYRSFTDEEKAELPEEKFVALFPLPLGVEVAGTREFFEKTLPSIVESEDAAGHVELAKAVNTHFDARLADILQESS